MRVRRVKAVAVIYIKDIHGSTTDLIDAAGNAHVSYTYDVFGETTKYGDLENEIAYTGGIYDEVTGQYYLNARYYDPFTARFLSQDTYRGDIEEPDSSNLYVYCSNDPVNFEDPSGHKKKIIFKSLYATLSKKQKKKLNRGQRKALKSVPTKKCHFKRNKYNTGLPKTEKAARKRGWKVTFGNWAHQFNLKTDIGCGRKCENRKYYKGNKEVIFHCDGSKDNTPEDRGSYNYGGRKGRMHTLKEVVPWVAWGNSSTKYGNKGNDSTTCIMRRICVPQSCLGAAKNAIKALKILKMYSTVRS